MIGDELRFNENQALDKKDVKWPLKFAATIDLDVARLATSLSRGKNGSLRAVFLRRNKSGKNAFFPSPVFSARETCSKSKIGHVYSISNWESYHVLMMKSPSSKENPITQDSSSSSLGRPKFLLEFRT